MFKRDNCHHVVNCDLRGLEWWTGKGGEEGPQN